MIVLGPLTGLVLGLTSIRRSLALQLTSAAALLGAALLGVASWHDERTLPVGYWVSVVIFFGAAIGICLAARAVRERAR